MKGKRTYGSPLPSPEKPAGKRRCLVNPAPHSTRASLDLAPPGETDLDHDPPSDNVPEVETCSRSAANLNSLTQNSGPHDQSDHDTQQPPGTRSSQALELIDESPMIKQEDGLVDTTSGLLKARAADKETERQHQAETATERERTANASATAALTQHQCDRLSSRICELEEKIKICAKEALKLECELESKRCKEVDTLKLEHFNRYERLKLKFKQEYHVVRKALEESEEIRHQDAVRHANLFVESADTLSEQIKKAEDMKVACEKILETTKKVHDIEVAKLHVNLRWLEDKVKRALAKEAEDHGAHLHTRNQLAKAEDQIEELKQKEQEMASAKEELQRQHEQQLAEVRDSYEQKLELAKQEHEADNALGEERICDLEAEMDAMCQEKDELYHERDQMCEKMVDAYQDLEFSHAHEMREANEEIERLEQSLRTMSEELKEVKEEKLQLGKDMDEAEETMDELCQEAQDSEAGHKQEMSEAASRQRELEREVKNLRGALEGIKQEDNDLREQLQKAKKGTEELVEREQALVSQCAADRLMFDRSAFALRSLLHKN